MLSLFKRIAIRYQLVRCLSTNYDDLINQKLTKYVESQEKRLKRVEKLDRKILNKRVFSLDQSFEERKECILTEMQLLKEEGIRMPSEISELNWKLLTKEPNRVVYNLL
jgi:hypothetical protein